MRELVSLVGQPLNIIPFYLLQIKAQLQLLSGSPGEAIVKAAEDDKADMIIMGSRGLNRYRRTLLGSVSDYVLHHAHCPVCICRVE